MDNELDLMFDQEKKEADNFMNEDIDNSCIFFKQVADLDDFDKRIKNKQFSNHKIISKNDNIKNIKEKNREQMKILNDQQNNIQFMVPEFNKQILQQKKVIEKPQLYTGSQIDENQIYKPTIQDIPFALSQRSFDQTSHISELSIHEICEDLNLNQANKSSLDNPRNQKILHYIKQNNLMLQKIQLLNKKLIYLFRNITLEMNINQSKQNSQNLIQQQKENQYLENELKTPFQEQDISQSDLKKIALIEKKTHEIRLQEAILKKDIQKAIKIIQRDIGDQSPDEYLLSETWKGRNTQIANLSKRIRFQQLNSVAQSKNQTQNTTQNSTFKPQFSIKTQKKDSLSFKEKRILIDGVNNTIEDIKNQIQSLNTQFKGAKARNKVLESEIEDLQQKIEIDKQVIQLLQGLLENSQQTDNYIMDLKKELYKQRKLQEKNVIIKSEVKTIEIIKDAYNQEYHTDIQILKLLKDQKKDLDDSIKNQIQINKQGKQALPIDREIQNLQKEYKRYQSQQRTILDASAMDTMSVKQLTQQSVQLRSKMDQLVSQIK